MNRVVIGFFLALAGFHIAMLCGLAPHFSIEALLLSIFIIILNIDK